MKKKWWLALAALIAIALFLAIGIPILLPPTPGVTYANYSRIQKGMTRDEVEAILGRPNVLDNKDAWAWRNDDKDEIEVNVDPAGRVNWVAWNEIVDDRTVWEKLRDRVPLLAKPPPAFRSSELL